MSQKNYLINVRFLVVDDNAFMRKIMRNILMAFGASEIREAPDGADALKILGTWPTDIIISDYVMQPFDGVELTQMIRSSDEVIDKYIPIIMMSAHAEEWRVAKARDAGINEFLVKPLTAIKVISHIRAVIEQPRKFVQSRQFFGPDRRRREKNFGDERRNRPPTIVAEPHFDDMHVGKHSFFFAEREGVTNAPNTPNYHRVIS
ncbi:response regulator [Pseudomonadota bacterium]